MYKSKIEWTETTWNPLAGCSRVSKGCERCYAEIMANRLQAIGVSGYEGVIKNNRWTGRINLLENKLQQPLHWKKPRMIFVNSMSDLFHPEVPFTFIDSVYEVMGFCKHHIFQILTKRPERALEYYKWTNIFNAWHEWNHIWLGVSVENQETANKRIPLLLQIPAKVKWLSCEPLLSPIQIFDVSGWYPEFDYWGKEIKIDWVVVGGESGPRRRPFDLHWADSLRDQCKMNNVPFFFKQVDKVLPIPERLNIKEMPHGRKNEPDAIK